MRMKTLRERVFRQPKIGRKGEKSRRHLITRLSACGTRLETYHATKGWKSRSLRSVLMSANA